MMGDANASIPTPQPIASRPMYGAMRTASFGTSCVVFVSGESVASGSVLGYGLAKRIEAVKNIRGVGKKDMVLNDLLPKITVDPETYEVHVDGELIRVAPAASVCMARNSFLF
jgi:urease alpha subunit